MSEIPDNSMAIADDEVVYRAVMNEPRYFPTDDKGIRRISSMAFNDAGRRPSVNRASLCSTGPQETRDRFSPGSGVLSLLAADIREIKASHGATGQVYAVDVEPVPLPDNLAHAEIFGRPPFDTDKVFDRIKQALARIAVVELWPENI